MPIEFTLHRGQPQDLVSLAELSDTVFRQSLLPGTGMGNEFPLMFSPNNATHLFYAAADGEPVALVGLWPGQVKMGDVRLRVLAMGSVCTAPEYRKQHLVSRLIEQILDEYRRAADVLLVSGDLNIYRRVGCVEFGARTEVLFGSRAKEEKHKYKIAPMVGLESDALQQLFDIYQSESYRYVRTKDEFYKLMHALKVPMYRARPILPQVFVAYKGDVPVAYMVASFLIWDGKGVVDVIEWAGDREAVSEFVRYLQDWYHTEHVRLHAYPHDELFHTVVTDESTVLRTVQNQGTVRVLDLVNLLSAYRPWLTQKYGATLSIEETAPEVWQVSWSSEADRHVPDHLADVTLHGHAELGAWLFSEGGLLLPLVHTDDLNYV